MAEYFDRTLEKIENVVSEAVKRIAENERVDENVVLRALIVNVSEDVTCKSIDARSVFCFYSEFSKIFVESNKPSIIEIMHLRNIERMYFVDPLYAHGRWEAGISFIDFSEEDEGPEEIITKFFILSGEPMVLSETKIEPF